MRNIELWKNWEQEKHYGQLFYKRAVGESPEMESSKAVSNIIKDYYTGNETILDVGCGAGHYLKSLRNIVDKNINYCGIDPTPYYIEMAHKAYNSTAHFAIGSIFNIPYPDNYFDIVMCNNVIMHLPPEDIKKAFDELIRVSRNKIIVRAMFGERNYVVKEVLTENDITPGSEQMVTYNNFDITQSRFRYFNMYTESFYQHLIYSHNGVTLTISPDKNWQQFNNIPEAKSDTATKTLADFQVSGNIILDWRFIIIDKENNQGAGSVS